MTLDSTYQAAVRSLGTAEERGDLDTCGRIEQDLVAVAHLYFDAIGELRVVSGITEIGLSLKGEVLTHVLDRFESETCEEVLALIVAFTRDVSCTYTDVGSTSSDLSHPPAESQSDAQDLSARVRVSLKLRCAQVLSHMSATVDADPAIAERVGAEFREGGVQLNQQLGAFTTCALPTLTDVLALAEVIDLLVQRGVGSEGFDFVLPLSLRLCDAIVTRNGVLPS